MAQTAQTLTAATKRMQADPQFQAAYRAWQDYKARTGVWFSGHGVIGPVQEVNRIARQYLPEGTYLSGDAQGNPVIKNKGLPSWVYPLAIGAGAATAGWALGAFAPAAASAAVPTAAATTTGAIPTITGTAVTSGMASAAPSLYGQGAPGNQPGSYPTIPDVPGVPSPDRPNTGLNVGDDAPDWLKAVLGGLAGLPGLFANRGPSDEERAYQAQASRLLRQQEQRTQFQNPLYEAVTRMAYGLQPTMGTQGQPYRYNTLDDVDVPDLNELIAAQRRT